MKVVVNKTILTSETLPTHIVLASNNAGKLNELQRQLSPLAIQIETQRDYALDSIEETGTTFVENAILKARHVATHTGLPALADDSGLHVDALDGAPGVYSARYAGVDASDSANVNALLHALVDIPNDQRQAHYYCCLVLMRHDADPTPMICQGRWHGRILSAPIGNNGFGYDPIFFVPEYQCSAAELNSAQKNRISHRAQAMLGLLAVF